jgi:hypothetical protein
MKYSKKDLRLLDIDDLDEIAYDLLENYSYSKHEELVNIVYYAQHPEKKEKWLARKAAKKVSRKAAKKAARKAHRKLINPHRLKKYMMVKRVDDERPSPAMFGISQIKGEEARVRERFAVPVGKSKVYHRLRWIDLKDLIQVETTWEEYVALVDQGLIPPHQKGHGGSRRSKVSKSITKGMMVKVDGDLHTRSRYEVRKVKIKKHKAYIVHDPTDGWGWVDTEELIPVNIILEKYMKSYQCCYRGGQY